MRFGLVALFLAACGSSGSDGGGGGTEPGADAGPGSIGGQPSDVKLDVIASTRAVQTRQTHVPVHVTRTGGKAPVTFVVEGLPAGVTAQTPTIAVDADQGDIVFEADPNASKQGQTATVTIKATSETVQTSATTDILVAGPPGTVDSSFGNGGAFLPPVDPTAYPKQFVVNVLASKGKYFLHLLLQNAANKSFTAVQRLNADWTLDTSYGTNGLVLVDAPHSIGSSLLMTDGSILFVTGQFDIDINKSKIMYIRLLENGTLDATWQAAGVGTRVLDFNAQAGASRSKIASLGGKDQLYLAGAIIPLNNNDVNDNFVVRLKDDFSAYDPTFHGGTPIETPASNGATNAQSFDVIPHADGSSFVLTRTQAIINPPLLDLSLYAYANDGTPLTSFGSGGRLPLESDPSGAVDDGLLASFTDGSVAAVYGLRINPDTKVKVRRFDATGQAKLYAVPDRVGIPRALQVLPDQSLFVVVSTPTNGVFWTTHFKADGALDADYGSNGMSDVKVHDPATSTSAPTLVVDSIGRYVISHQNTLVRVWN